MNNDLFCKDLIYIGEEAYFVKNGAFVKMVDPDSKKPVVYVAGKITGLPNFKEYFEEAEEILSEKGYTVINPASLPGGMDPGDYMRICLSMVDTADIVYFLPNHVSSSGAQIEEVYARYIGKKLVYNIHEIKDVAQK